MPADERFTFRAYTAGDESSIIDLFTRAFGTPRSIEHWRWKYEESPYGQGRVALAIESNRVVAQYGAYPVPFWYKGRDLLAHHVADIMSDPAVRHIGRGATSIFARTAARFYTDFCEQKIAFNYGFSTATSRAFGNRFLGVQTVEPVTYRVRENVNPMSRVQRWLAGYHLELVRDVGSDYDEFFARVAPSYEFLIRRDAEYIRWRYLHFSERGYFVIAIRKRRRLIGWCAFRVVENKLVWGDALFDKADPKAIEILIRHVAPTYPVTKIECWFPPRPSWFDAALSRLGFSIHHEPNDLALGCAPFIFNDVVPVMRASLYYAMGDSDLF